ncbi:PQQ-binding-like beta-propeller repeat protein [Brachybacterium sp. UNK5269]|uniref:outer membrane protein assembly factor BamB family protein n=1 Tax=Brachybacterium sp. UNK5269 TaxID=3408576 RepID=UPI003BB1C788
MTLDGVPVALDGHRIVLRRCAGELCELSGVDLTAPDRALWTLGDTAAARGIDPAGIEVPARPDRPPGPLDAARATGVLPAVPLRFDPAQGWIQLDAATGFPVGRILAAPEDPCRITVTGEPPRALDPLQPVPLVLTVCSAPDGALRAAAFRAGERLWQSQASPGGDWSVRLDQGRVLATGTEAGTATVGEIVASEHRAAWTAPGADQGAWASTFTARLGIDGARMIVTNQAGQLVAYDTADGADAWTLPLPTDAGVRGSLAAGTAVVLDPAARQRPLAPRGAQRLRVIDADRGAVVVETVLADQVDAVHPVGGGRALVTADGHSLLLGP